MKTKVTFIAAAVLFVSFFSSATKLPGKAKLQKKDKAQQIFDIRVNKNNLVVLRATIAQNNKRQSFIVKVYSEERSLLYASSFRKKGNVLIPFDISKFPKGKYTFIV